MAHTPEPAHTDRRQWLALALVAAITPLNAAGAEPPSPGASAPALEGTTSDGKRVNLTDHRNRVVLVFYWSTGCAVR